MEGIFFFSVFAYMHIYIYIVFFKKKIQNLYGLKILDITFIVAWIQFFFK